MAKTPWRIGRGETLALDRPTIIAILNVTPDSFSDGGELATPAHAAKAAASAITAGADVLDIGGESTRPGAARVSDEEQLRRVIPAIRAIRAEVGERVPISIDTTRAAVADAAIDAGASIINDVAAGLEDPEILGLAARRGIGLILMHRLAPPQKDSYSDKYQSPPDYAAQGGVVNVVAAFLRERMTAVIAAGVEADRIVLDPGLGFGKTVEQNLELIRQTPRLLELGRPILSAVSRKSFTARAAGLGPGTDPRSRVSASVQLSLVHFAAGARLFRVHDVAEHAQALKTLHEGLSESSIH